VKDFLQSLGLTEIFAYLGPGAILVFSTALWLPYWLLAALATAPLLLVAPPLLVAAYGLGIAVATVAGVGAQWSSRAGLDEPVRFAVRLVCAVPKLPENTTTVDARLRILESFQKHTRITGAPVDRRPVWDLYALYRLVISGQEGIRGSPLLFAADSVHNRLLFALGAGLALMLVAAQALGRVAWRYLLPLPRVYPALYVSDEALVLLGMGCVAASFVLRGVASRFAAQEFLLTCPLMWQESKPHPAPASPATAPSPST